MPSHGDIVYVYTPRDFSATCHPYYPEPLSQYSSKIMNQSNNSHLAQPSNRIRDWVHDTAAKARQHQFSPPSRVLSRKKSSVQPTTNQNGSTSSLVANTGLVSPHISSASSSEWGDGEWEKIDLSNEQSKTGANKRSSEKPKKPDIRANIKMDEFGDAFKPTLKKTS